MLSERHVGKRVTQFTATSFGRALQVYTTALERFHPSFAFRVAYRNTLFSLVQFSTPLDLVHPSRCITAAVLQEEGNVMAAIPHLVGIVCGHVYHFFTVVHPLMGAKRRVGAPAWMKRRLDGGDNPNFMEAPGENHDEC